MAKAISEKEYTHVLESAARILIDNEEAECTGRKPLYDIDASSFDEALGLTVLDAPTPCGKPLGECTKEDLDVNIHAHTMVIDYLMLRATINDMCAKRLPTAKKPRRKAA